MKAVTCQSLQILDREATESFSIPSVALMENAGYQSYLQLSRWEDFSHRPVLFFIGSGNNGGDGLVMARHLFNNHPRSRVVIIFDSKKTSRSELNRLHLDIARKSRIPVYDYREVGKIRRATGDRPLLIDALLGIGAVSRPAEGGIAEMISLLNEFRKKNQGEPSATIALDIPSGIFPGWTSDIPAVTADLTLTYGLNKDILYYPALRPLAGEILILNPGFPSSLLERVETSLKIADPETITDMIPPYRSTDYKKSRGRIAVVAGKRGMLGAAALTVGAGWKAGAGLITLFVPPADRALLTRSLPHTMVATHDDFQNYHNQPLKNDFDTVVFGPGLGRPENSADLRENILVDILQQQIPVVIDADGLYHYKNVLEGKKSRILQEAPVILTPHLGEIRHLLSGIESPDPGNNPFTAAENFFQHYRLRNTVLVLKCHLNYILSPKKVSVPWVVEGGNPLLGVGGSGDVLAGIIGALTARQYACGEDGARLRGAVSGCYIHQEAGRRARKQHGIFTAKELLPLIPEALEEFIKVYP